MVVDKPSGMAVHSGSGLPWGLIDVRSVKFGRTNMWNSSTGWTGKPAAAWCWREMEPL